LLLFICSSSIDAEKWEEAEASRTAGAHSVIPPGPNPICTSAQLQAAPLDFQPPFPRLRHLSLRWNNPSYKRKLYLNTIIYAAA
jgi:hypothetical protein